MKRFVARNFCFLSDNHNDEHGHAGLPRIEIYEHGLVQRKQAGLIVTETNREWRAVLQESHERDLNSSPCSIQDVTELHDVH